MSSVLARYEVSGERRKPKPSGSTSSVPSPKIETPFFAWLFSSAKMRSCLRIRLAFSMPLDTAMSTSCETWCAFSSERCIGIATGLAAGVPAFCAGVESWGCCERTASGWAACDLLMLGTYVRTAAPEPWRWTTLLDSPPSGMEGALTQARIKASDVAVKESGQLRLRQRAHARRLDVAVLEEHQRGDAADAEFRRNLLVLVDVDLGDLQAAFVFLGDLVQDRCDRFARPAPFGPVIDQDRGVGFQDFRLERVVRHMLDCGYACAAHGSSWVLRHDFLLWGRSRRFPRDILNS